LKEKINILGLNIENASYEEVLNCISIKIAKREKLTFHNVNVNILLTCLKNPDFRKNLESFTALYSDGTGVYAASKFCYGKRGLKKRLNGTDLYSYILEYADSYNLKIFFLGGSDESVKLLPGVLHSKYPGIIIDGIISREKAFKFNPLEEIQKSDADILFTGLGTPYQENWIAENSNSLKIPVQVAVGSGLEFISGAKKRAPAFFIKLGLEWFYRIYLEPKRLWKRYVFGIPIFMFKIIIFRLKLLTIKDNNRL